jgi:hypothetical protein
LSCNKHEHRKLYSYYTGLTVLNISIVNIILKGALYTVKLVSKPLSAGTESVKPLPPV